MMITMREFRELHSAVDLIYKEADKLGYDWTTLAEQAGLGYSTVCRLGNYTTMYPRAQTVLLLARAVGLVMRLEKKKLKLKAAR